MAEELTTKSEVDVATYTALETKLKVEVAARKEAERIARDVAKQTTAVAKSEEHAKNVAQEAHTKLAQELATIRCDHRALESKLEAERTARYEAERVVREAADR